MAVDAPTLYDMGLNTQEKRIPPKDDVKYSVISFQDPSPFSNPEPMTTVDSRSRMRWTRLACNSVGVMNLHTYPLFLIFLASFQPRRSRALGFGASNSVLIIGRIQIEIRNMMISTKTMKTVKVQHLTVGHRFFIKAPKKVSSLALFSLF
jgi:hypothetical protein